MSKRYFLVGGRDNCRVETALIGTGWKVEKEIPSDAVLLTRAEVEGFRDSILHGDDEHRAWRVSAFKDFLDPYFGPEPKKGGGEG